MACFHTGCTKVFKTKKGLQFHLDTVHAESVPVFKCTVVIYDDEGHEEVDDGDADQKRSGGRVCDKVFCHRSSLLAHMKTAHSKTERPTFKCEMDPLGCSKTFLTRQGLQYHIASVHDNNLISGASGNSVDSIGSVKAGAKIKKDDSHTNNDDARDKYDDAEILHKNVSYLFFFVIYILGDNNNIIYLFNK